MVLQYIDGVDHLLAEYDIYRDLMLPIHRAIRNLPKEATTASSTAPDAVFLQGISGSNE